MWLSLRNNGKRNKHDTLQRARHKTFTRRRLANNTMGLKTRRDRESRKQTPTGSHSHELLGRKWAGLKVLRNTDELPHEGRGEGTPAQSRRRYQKIENRSTPPNSHELWLCTHRAQAKIRNIAFRSTPTYCRCTINMPTYARQHAAQIYTLTPAASAPATSATAATPASRKNSHQKDGGWPGNGLPCTRR